MITKIECSTCGKELGVVDIIVNPLQLSTIKVKPCRSIDCYDCKECEMEQENKGLKSQLEEIQKIVKHAKS